jgi:hypothetical protein
VTGRAVDYRWEQPLYALDKSVIPRLCTITVHKNQKALQVG